MPSINTAFLLKTSAFSALNGLRSMTPLALLSYHFGHQLSAPRSTFMERFGSKAANVILGSMAIGEFVGDKLPNTPARTAWPPLIGRAITGSGTGALLWQAHDQPVWLGALVGGGSAVLSTYLSYYLRIYLDQKLPFPMTAVLEDYVALLSGWWLLSALEDDEAPTTT